LRYCVDVVAFRGHRNVRAEHPTTLEVTKDEFLTPRGDCIVGVASNKGASEIDNCVKEVLRGGGRLLAVLVVENGLFDYIAAEGSDSMTFSDDRRIIIRRSTYVDGSTVGIKASKAAKDIRRDIVESLKQGLRGYLILAVAEDTASDGYL
jgi:hypothetical protein